MAKAWDNTDARGAGGEVNQKSVHRVPEFVKMFSYYSTVLDAFHFQLVEGLS